MLFRSTIRDLADRQRAEAHTGDLEALRASSQHRDRLTGQLLAAEATARQLRTQLSDAGAEAARLPGFADVAALHDRTREAVQGILAVDAESIAGLEGIVAARRAAAQALDLGGSTLDAYSRVTASAPAASLVSRVG